MGRGRGGRDASGEGGERRDARPSRVRTNLDLVARAANTQRMRGGLGGMDAKGGCGEGLTMGDDGRAQTRERRWRRRRRR